MPSHYQKHVYGAARLFLGAFKKQVPNCEPELLELLKYDGSIPGEEADFVETVIGMISDPFLYPLPLDEDSFARCLYIDDQPQAWEEVLLRIFNGSIYLHTLQFDGKAIYDETVCGAIQYQDDYTFVLLDLSLPGRDGVSPNNGLQLLKALRAYSSCPVVVLTAHDDVLWWRRTLEAGADDYFYKTERGSYRGNSDDDYFQDYHKAFEQKILKAVRMSQPQGLHFRLSNAKVEDDLDSHQCVEVDAQRTVCQLLDDANLNLDQIRTLKRTLERGSGFGDTIGGLALPSSDKMLTALMGNLLECLFMPLLRVLDQNLPERVTLGKAIEQSQAAIRKKKTQSFAESFRRVAELWTFRNQVLHRDKTVSIDEVAEKILDLASLAELGKLHQLYAVARGVPWKTEDLRTRRKSFCDEEAHLLKRYREIRNGILSRTGHVQQLRDHVRVTETEYHERLAKAANLNQSTESIARVYEPKLDKIAAELNSAEVELRGIDQTGKTFQRMLKAPVEALFGAMRASRKPVGTSL